MDIVRCAVKDVQPGLTGGLANANEAQLHFLPRLGPIGSRRGPVVPLKQSEVLEMVQKGNCHMLCIGLTWGPR